VVCREKSSHVVGDIALPSVDFAIDRQGVDHSIKSARNFPLTNSSAAQRRGAAEGLKWAATATLTALFSPDDLNQLRDASFLGRGTGNLLRLETVCGREFRLAQMASH
jgi:hypothetical protein